MLLRAARAAHRTRLAPPTSLTGHLNSVLPPLCIPQRGFARELDRTDDILQLSDEEKSFILGRGRQDHIRNFSIIAHIDHGKSTLADRLLSYSGNISAEQRKAGQVLDKLEVERARGITVKAQTASIFYRRPGSTVKSLADSYLLNLIDCPGHVDFSYEVSRSLAACEGALLLVDSSQGIQAQTLANYYIAMENDLTIIPVMTKLDLPYSDPEAVSAEMVSAFGCKPEDILKCSAKTGEGISTLFPAIIDRIPPPSGRSYFRAPIGKQYYITGSNPAVTAYAAANTHLMGMAGATAASPSPATPTPSSSSTSTSSSSTSGASAEASKSKGKTTTVGSASKTQKAAVEHLPPSNSDGFTTAPLRALIFDSWVDAHRGVVCLVKIVDGEMRKGDVITTYHVSGGPYEVQEVGVLSPEAVSHLSGNVLRTGQVGYMLANIKETNEVRLGDTIISIPRVPAVAVPGQTGLPDAGSDKEDGVVSTVSTTANSFWATAPLHELRRLGMQEARRRLREIHALIAPLPGFLPAKSMVFAGLFPTSDSDFNELSEAMEKLTLNDSSVSISKEHSLALGPGFRCGFLGLLHMDVFITRLEQEFQQTVITTAPTVPYSALMDDGTTIDIESPAAFPTDLNKVDTFFEPMVKVSIVTPHEYAGALTQLCGSSRGEVLEVKFLTANRALMRYKMPLAEVVVDFYQQIKSLSSGYASLDYEPAGDEEADIVKLDIRINGESVDALSAICHRSKSDALGRRMLSKLKDSVDRQNFEVIIQACVGNKILAKERIAPYRKDVLTKSGKTVGGGDMTRKKKLLEKQKEGKKRMKAVGNVELSDEAFLSVLKAQSRD